MQCGACDFVPVKTFGQKKILSNLASILIREKEEENIILSKFLSSV